MIKDYLTYINTALLAILILGSFGAFGHVNTKLLGASTCTGTITCLYDLNLFNDSGSGIGGASLYQNGVGILGPSGALSATTFTATTSITDAGSLSIGGGTALAKTVCVTTSTALASQAQNATATIDFTMSGVSTSSHQAYFFGIASSSAGWTDIETVSITPSSTANRITVETKNLSSATFAPGQATFSLCYVQF